MSDTKVDATEQDEPPIKPHGGAMWPYGAVLVSWIVAAGVAWAGSQGGALLGSWPLMMVCIGIAFAVQWIVFVPSWFGHTEHYFDITGSVTYLGVTLLAYWFGPQDLRATLITAFIVIWAVRLGTFLFNRVRADGRDRRFDKMKYDFSQFFMTWNLQGLWVSFTLASALAALTTADPKPLGLIGLAGIALWMIGFALEVIADGQKTRFKRDPAMAGEFIRSGLWAWSRHPNYFGEIVLWVGIALMAYPVLAGWQLATLISPVFVILLLTKISGERMLEARSDRRWGSDPEYQAYRSNTSVLVPLPPKSR